MSKKDGPLILFDWAVKQLLRNRANFEVVEGFLSELWGRDIKITGVLESESNQTDPDFTYDRVDMTVEDELKEPVSVKIQFTYDTNCFQRMLYKTAKAATDPKIKKNCFINIVYFDVS
ncbi:MAG: hypothetical protein LBQ01_08240, partial [Prevotellaceae bacterium]|nr:hypothetical protein [Prevotellaceae bacterium]